MVKDIIGEKCSLTLIFNNSKQAHEQQYTQHSRLRL